MSNDMYVATFLCEEAMRRRGNLASGKKANEMTKEEFDARMMIGLSQAKALDEMPFE